MPQMEEKQFHTSWPLEHLSLKCFDY